MQPIPIRRRKLTQRAGENPDVVEIYPSTLQCLERVIHSPLWGLDYGSCDNPAYLRSTAGVKALFVEEMTVQAEDPTICDELEKSMQFHPHEDHH